MHLAVGLTLGYADGTLVGDALGDCEGIMLGLALGLDDGDAVGAFDTVNANKPEYLISSKRPVSKTSTSVSPDKSSLQQV